MSSAESQREFKRAKGSAPVICQDVMGRLWDISRTGLAFSVGEKFDAFETERSYPFTIKVPKSEENPTGMVVKAHGTVRSLRMDPRDRRLIVGLSFADLSEAERESINRIILHFVRSYEPLQRLDEIMTIKKPAPGAESGPGAPASAKELAPFFHRVIAGYDGLPEPARALVADFVRAMGPHLKS